MTTGTLTLTEFLTARIAEDEARAHSLETVSFQPRWKTDVGGGVVEEPPPMIDPRARMLAECEAKRRIVDALACLIEPDPVRRAALEFACRSLAMAYADHTDYREDWRA